LVPIKDWPVAAMRDWVSFVNRAETGEELEAIRRSVVRGAPYGDARWQKRTAARLKLESSLRPPWRPRKVKPSTKQRPAPRKQA
jgi:putative transposase